MALSTSVVGSEIMAGAELMTECFNGVCGNGSCAATVFPEKELLRGLSGWCGIIAFAAWAATSKRFAVIDLCMGNVVSAGNVVDA